MSRYCKVSQPTSLLHQLNTLYLKGIIEDIPVWWWFWVKSITLVLRALAIQRRKSKMWEAPWWFITTGTMIEVTWHHHHWMVRTYVHTVWISLASNISMHIIIVGKKLWDVIPWLVFKAFQTFLLMINFFIQLYLKSNSVMLLKDGIYRSLKFTTTGKFFAGTFPLLN